MNESLSPALVTSLVFSLALLTEGLAAFAVGRWIDAGHERAVMTGGCTEAQIVNAYDNALLYTDHLLAATIAQLKARSDEIDSALIYVSDHGESLGENGLYLHGLPYSIAPAEQTRVPMVIWLSSGFAARNRLDPACLRTQAGKPAAHDNLFHTVLGLLDVRTAVRDDTLDLTATCRS